MSKKTKIVTSTGMEVRQKPLKLRIWNNRGHYLMFLPVFIFVLIVNYWPMLGIRYAFMEYKAGPAGPSWTGLTHFSTGMLNGLLREWGILGANDSNIHFLATSSMWRPIFYLINIWKETGWGTIIFLATLAGISPELYEAADIDGATRFQKMRYVTLPALSNTIITVLILNLAKVLNLFESVFVLYNPAVYNVSDVIGTYIYRQTFSVARPDYGYSTAVGLFRSLVGCVLVLICNRASKKVRGRGIV